MSSTTDERVTTDTVVRVEFPPALARIVENNPSQPGR